MIRGGYFLGRLKLRPLEKDPLPAGIDFRALGLVEAGSDGLKRSPKHETVQAHVTANMSNENLASFSALWSELYVLVCPSKGAQSDHNLVLPYVPIGYATTAPPQTWKPRAKSSEPKSNESNIKPGALAGQTGPHPCASKEDEAHVDECNQG